jgi:glycerol-3-phosphate dehydrogenase (NAD(P)+)
MARVTVFGAGAMGTAVAMHSARIGLDAAIWANPYDGAALESIRDKGRHPGLPEHVPPSLAVFGPDELDAAAAGCEVAVMGSSSGGARSLAEMTREAAGGARFVISLGKGLEPETAKRMSELYGEEFPDAIVIAVGGPGLAGELASGQPTASVWGSTMVDDARAAGAPFEDAAYQIAYTDDVIGLEFCTVLKNVAAIGMGFLDGMAKTDAVAYQNAKAALFTQAVRELSDVVEAVGGRRETAIGLAGLGDVLVTSLGGRNRLYGELVGAGGHPTEVLEDLSRRGVTVEGVESTKDLNVIAERTGVDLPYHLAIHRVLFHGADPRTILEVLL